MKWMFLRLMVCLALLRCAATACAADSTPVSSLTVDVATKPGEKWKAYPTRTIEQLPHSVRAKIDTGFSQYGGLLSHKVEAKGFFYAKNVGERWWLVDPEGCLFLHKAVVSVSAGKTPGALKAMKEKFGGEKQWASGTASFLREHGFNGTGAWTDTQTLSTATPRLAYTRVWNFMSSYGKQRGGTYQQPGHTGYTNDCIFVFDPDFEKFCDDHARQMAAAKNDPWLLGHFSDNEMPLKHEALKGYLTLPENDPGHQAALAWLCSRHGANASVKDITEADKAEFLALIVDRYFGAVSRAIKKYDPNHLYLGSRFHGSALRYPEVFKTAGKYLDVVSVNYYRAWTPDPERLNMWARESGKPIMITEWYAKGMDSGLGNTTGAGWLVKTQRDRGLFYQNFVLGLLESKVCVGWHWFKYMDNDPEDTKADPSNRDSNKGIVNARYVPYTELLYAMKPVNDRVYSLAAYFDNPN
ncbi:MAG: hypothetical protein WCP12_09990 [bacterium]